MTKEENARLYAIVDRLVPEKLGPPDESDQHWTLDLGNLQWLIHAVVVEYVSQGKDK